jgi:hypothetical protein
MARLRPSHREISNYHRKIRKEEKQLMIPRTFSLTSCTILSLVNVVGFFLFARYADALGYVGKTGIASFSVSIGLLTMLVASALLIWSFVDHFLIEPTGNTAFALSVNLGFLAAFIMI